MIHACLIVWSVVFLIIFHLIFWIEHAPPYSSLLSRLFKNGIGCVNPDQIIKIILYDINHSKNSIYIISPDFNKKTWTPKIIDLFKLKTESGIKVTLICRKLKNCYLSKQKFNSNFELYTSEQCTDSEIRVMDFKNTYISEPIKSKQKVMCFRSFGNLDVVERRMGIIPNILKANKVGEIKT